MTEEASFIIPVAIAVIFFAIYSAFYLYNRCVITQYSYTAAYRESVWKKKGSSGAEDIMQSYEGIFLHDYEYNVSGGAKAKAQGSGSVYPAFIQSMFPYIKSQWKLTAGMSARRYDPPKSFRRYRRTAAVLMKGSGASND